ncbi:Kinase-like protein [Trema orientale]|uniref:Kinase-like protein n=1 Tax=Trema orientale TaxID=63057 RepID=A0A2P5EL82_TREOI|nr:Kinase-like protein [Trema orientale]
MAKESNRNTITISAHEADTSKQKVDESKESINKVSTVSSSAVKPLCNLEDVIYDSQSSSSSNLHAKIRGTIEIKKIVRSPFATFFQRHQNIVQHCRKCSICVEHINGRYLPPVIEWNRGDCVQGWHLEALVEACNNDYRSVSVYGNGDHLVILKKVLGEIKLTKHGRLTPVAVNFIKDIVFQLDELHASGRTYGNLKPQNIFIIREVRRISAKLSNTSSGNDGQPQRRMDENMLDLGRVLFFLITDGKHPRFGGFQNNKVENLSSVKDPEARDLISRLLEPYPTLRPKASEVLSFPQLWKRESRIGFLCVTKSLMFKYPYLMNELDKITLDDIGANREGKPVGGWDETMPVELINHMLTFQSQKKEKNQMLKEDTNRDYRYDYGRVPDLLLIMRNVEAHYMQFPEHIKKLMIGVSRLEDLDDYFRSRFPALLLKVHECVVYANPVCRYFENEPDLQTYFNGSA